MGLWPGSVGLQPGVLGRAAFEGGLKGTAGTESAALSKITSISPILVLLVIFKAISGSHGRTLANALCPSPAPAFPGHPERACVRSGLTQGGWVGLKAPTVPTPRDILSLGSGTLLGSVP